MRKPCKQADKCKPLQWANAMAKTNRTCSFLVKSSHVMWFVVSVISLLKSRSCLVGEIRIGVRLRKALALDSVPFRLRWVSCCKLLGGPDVAKFSKGTPKKQLQGSPHVGTHQNGKSLDR